MSVPRPRSIDVAFVTTNPGKFAEARAILRPYGVRLRWVRQRLPELQSDDLAEVARAKAAAVRRVRGYFLVEDAGLFIGALADFPGVYSAHFLHRWGFPPIFRLLAGRPRGAEFRSAVVLRHGRTSRLFRGRVVGTIGRRAKGKGGFGYDPIFVPRGLHATFAQLPISEKNRLSHRARALRQAGAYLRRVTR